MEYVLYNDDCSSSALSVDACSLSRCMYASVNVCFSVYCVPVRSVGLSSVCLVAFIFPLFLQKSLCSVLSLCSVSLRMYALSVTVYFRVLCSCAVCLSVVCRLSLTQFVCVCVCVYLTCLWLVVIVGKCVVEEAEEQT